MTAAGRELRAAQRELKSIQRRRLAIAAGLGLAMSSMGFVFVLAAGPVIANANAGNAGDAASSAGAALQGKAAIGSYATTIESDAVSTNGVVGASGGLIALDSGEASVIGRLDSTPSSSIIATPLRPGSFAETVIGQVNGEGVKKVTVPQAEADYPGQGHGVLTTVKPTAAGPFSVSGGNAVANASARSMSGSATGQSSATGASATDGSATSTGASSAKPSAQEIDVSGTTKVSSASVAGVLDLHNVNANASIAVSHGRRKLVAKVTVGDATVAGQPVSIGENGVMAIGHGLLPGSTTASATKAANAALQTAGVSVAAVHATRHSGGRSSYAATGGIQINVSTPNLPGGVAANDYTMTLGSIVLTETDAAPLPSPPPISDSSPPAVTSSTTPAAAVSSTPPTVATKSHPSDSGGVAPVATPPSQPQISSSAGGGARPVIAPRSRAPRAERVLLTSGGFNHTEWLTAFAGWQFLSLLTPTLYAIASSRRRRGGVRPAR